MLNNLNEAYVQALLADRQRQARDACLAAEVRASRRQARRERHANARRRASWLRRALVAAR